MINYTYKIIRNEGDEKVIYEPKLIPQELPSLSYIEGPNSSGKSTLLNIIALGFKGNQRKDISKALISKMNSLMDNSYQQLSFEVNINENDNQLILSKEIDSEQIIIYEIVNGKKKPIAPELLEERYNLIYDIPDDPINRLRQLTITISNNQKFISRRVFDFQVFLQKQLDLAKNAKNPILIEKLEKEIKSKRIESDALNDEIIKNGEYLNKLEAYTYAKSYKEYSVSVNKIENEIDKLIKDLKKINKNNVNSYKSERKIMSEYQLDIIDNYDNLTPIIRQVLNDEKHILNLWDSLEKYIQDIFVDLNVSSSVKKITNSIESKFLNIINNSKNKDLILEVDTWKKVINLLSSLNKKDDTLVPGVDKSINEFINILKEEDMKYEKLVKKQEILEDGFNLIQKINKDLLYLENKILPKVKESNDASIKYIDDEVYFKKRIDNKILKKEELINFMNLYENECVNKGINITKDNELMDAINAINSLIDSNEIKQEQDHVLLNRIVQLKDLIKQNQNRLSNLNSFINIKENELMNLQNKEPYKYQELIPEINQIFMSCQKLDQKFKVNFEKYITKIINEDSTVDTKDQLQEKYYDCIAIYLGKKISEIKYIDNLYKVTRVDIVKREILTENNKVIRYDDMGTGQSQSAYFLGKLNSIDNRKVVVLIDEVAMMDKSSLEPIFKKLKDLLENGKLIAGLIVQKAENMSVNEI